MADFTIVAPIPFVVEGTDGRTYELPRLIDLSAEQIADMAAISESEGPADRMRATRVFVQSLCPELADEPLTDAGYMRLFAALGEGTDVGES